MKTNIAIIVIFSLLIFVPFGISIPQTKDLTNPQSGLIYSDYLIRADNIIKIVFLRYQQSNMVVIGKDGWLYVDTDESMLDYRGLVPYSESQLQYIQGIVQSEKDYLKVPLILAVAPNKESIYPEYMPDNIKKGSQTRLDQLVQYVDLIDLRTTLKTDKQSYRKNDTHWNYYGAYLAYSEILRKIGLKPHELSDYEQIIGETTSDLANLIKLPDIYNEPVIHLKLKDVESDKLGCALIFHDSFYETELRELMQPHFDRIKEVRFGQLTLFSSKLIEETNPDVVIYIMVERCVGRYFMPWN